MTNIAEPNTNAAGGDLGAELHEFVSELFPICRSITGDGLRETLRRIGERVPLELHEVPTGTQVFDWTIPREWNIRDAYVKDAAGAPGGRLRRPATCTSSTTACPSTLRMPLSELREHLTTIPEQPDWIPYRTSYYQRGLGLLPEPQLAPRARGRRVRGSHRLHARGREPDLRRVLPARRARRTRC